MTNLNLVQDVANKRERKKPAARIVAKSDLLWPAASIRRYGSLININPSDVPRHCSGLFHHDMHMKVCGSVFLKIQLLLLCFYLNSQAF